MLRSVGGTFGSGNSYTISGGTFNEVHGNYQVNFSGQLQDAGLIALSQAISHAAMYDSAERYPAGHCHPGTRKDVINTIMDWTKDPNPSYDTVWLYGPAGAGKSAIMQTIAELLQKLHRQCYAGSFFFASGKSGRDQGVLLFSTLAYQIAIYLPGMREAVNNAMSADITLPTKSFETQLNSLIIEPFMNCTPALSHTPTVLIDGLDECHGHETQRAILNLIAHAKTVAGVPLRFLIASRPEFWIRNTFDRQPLFGITKRLELSDSPQASLDIKKYLEDGFADIYNKNLDIMTGTEQPWPPTILIDRFVYEASGQFIYASTVLKFVGAEFCDPRRQLDIISNPGPLQASAFSDLDQLYTKILSAYPRPGPLVRVLGGLIVVKSVPNGLEKWLDVEQSELNMVLRAISSLVVQKHREIEDWDEDLEAVYGRPGPRISFCHLSFVQFILDSDRSGKFAVKLPSVHESFFHRCFDLIIGSFDVGKDHRDDPVVHDDMWDVVILDGPRYARYTEVARRLDDLRLAMQTFSTSEHWTTIKSKHLLRNISYARNALETIHNFYSPPVPLMTS
ncbi:hypothetical protein GALMADRAFT_715502 [Galerina marginata CBS 339.88]|uniref:NACHT domain-containing protein n=1 Tax=Galerina marginata (strain CBS 339.88) TaxID=685588 RepID=A0A067TZL1_GALM3|nr:hypothetical protein GALMADRAFT_715502 [Galerina marginata CBS 339.88]